MSHTILLVQPTEKIESRSWSDYETTTDCLDGICKTYEEFLRKKNPNETQIEYSISNLFDFIDNLHDLSILVFSPSTSQYSAHDKCFIKEHIFEMLQNRGLFE